MLDNQSPLTLQHQLKTLLMESIAQGHWQPGDRIPSEREICEQYGVSRITVREVLGELVQKNILVRKQGKGTFVAPPKFEQRLGSFYSFSEEIRKKGLEPFARILCFETLPASNHVAEMLALQVGAMVYRIERQRLIDKDLFAWEQSFVPCALVTGLSSAEVEALGLYHSIAKHTALIPDEAEETFEAVNCSSKEASLLGLETNQAALRLIRITKAQGHRIEYCETLLRGDKYKYTILLK